jgi:hypothetical protein
MGANAQTSVPLFVANSVLTAAQQNISAATGVPVFATTVTRDAAFGGSNKVLAEGQLCYIEASDVVQYYTGAAWATVGPATASALVRVGGGTLSGSSVAFTNVFSATYDNYIISVSDLTSASNAFLTLQLGATTSLYYNSINFATYTNEANFIRVGYIGTNGGASQIFIGNPFLAKRTVMNSLIANMTTGGESYSNIGFQNSNTSFTGFTLAGATFTAGTVNIYGLALS